MKTRSLLLVLLLMGVRQMHATNQVVVVSDNPPGLVRLSTNLADFAEAALSPAEAMHVSDVNLIAWAAKSSDLAFPPQVGEEAIVLLRWAEGAGKYRWCAAHLVRASDAAQTRSWVSARSQPVIPTKKTWESEPSEEDIAAFIRATNFGYNDFDPDVQVLRVVAYRKATSIVQALKEGVSDSEKSERRAKLRSVFWHRRL